MSSLSILALALIQALALLALAPLFSGISRVLRAKIHSRSGPDIFQDYRDILNCLDDKIFLQRLQACSSR